MIILWFWRESYHSVSAGQAPYFLPSGKSPCTKQVNEKLVETSKKDSCVVS